MKLLAGVHPDLVKVIVRAAELSPVPFAVIEGVRTLERQKHLLSIGATQTLNSRHLTGHATDIAPLGANGKVSWDWPLYHKLAPAVKQAAKELGIPIEWGGDWRSFKDGPHWQLPFRQYPKSSNRHVFAAGAFSEEVAATPETSYETDGEAATKAVASAGSAAIGSVSLGADPVATLVSNLASQQYELSSGDIVRIVVSLVILGVGFWYAWKKAKTG